MNMISLIFVVISVLVLGLGWWAINRKDEPPRRSRQER